ncbi:hypothetical protein HF325_004016 [Metschnikowia pulcherrima]|uniref:UBX domain-containing protein 1 n=1 Tax=Metschnikowia pulcherrima TaxID=27326 RepID=A0A8H7LBI0_9ASCO|nr:hypothetical protein HF325_004016 [Metschnikowia pulcherrima]
MSENLHLIESFVAVTNAPKSLAEQYLDRNGHDLTAAIEDFYNTNGEADSGSRGSPSPEQAFSRAKTPKSGGIRTLRDLDGADDEQDDKTDANFFTGGEKSALQVENPDKKKKRAEPSLVERIFQRASEQMNEEDDRPSAAAEEAPKKSFTGTGFRLGDSNQTLQVVFDAAASPKVRPAKVTREITFWRQGFTVGEGELRRYDDPENVLLLQELKQGRVPVSLLDVEFGQDVDVSVVRKVDEDFTPPKRKVGGFHGQGQRLGSPVPGEDLVPAPAASAEVPLKETTSVPTKKTPEGEGDSLVQIRFANGKRVSHKFNGTDSISVVYAFVRDHEYSDPLRQFILSHTFPVKPIEESTETTVELAKLKNAVIMQRWK